MDLRISSRNRWRNAALAVALLGALPTAAQSWKPWLSPADMARVDASMLSVERSSFCSENCRYDRHGDEPSLGNPRPNRWLYLDGSEAVLYDDPGAGVITRIWLTSGGPLPTCLDTSLRIHVYFGNASVALIDMPLAHLFDASTPPFTPPLTFNASSGSGGYTSYVPIPYQNGIRTACGAGRNKMHRLPWPRAHSNSTSKSSPCGAHTATPVLSANQPTSFGQCPAI